MGDCLVWSYSNSAQLPQIKHGGTKWGWNTIQLYPKLKINLTKLKDLVTKFDNATYIFQGKEAIWGWVEGKPLVCWYLVWWSGGTQAGPAQRGEWPWKIKIGICFCILVFLFCLLSVGIWCGQEGARGDWPQYTKPIWRPAIASLYYLFSTNLCTLLLFTFLLHFCEFVDLEINKHFWAVST